MKFKHFQAASMAAMVIAVAAGVSGCAMGNTSILSEDAGSVSQKLVTGKTRKEDVLKMWGEPSEKSFVDGQETWVYRAADTKFRTYVPFVGMAMGNNGVDTTDLTIVWQKNGTVARHSLTKAKDR